MEQTLLPDIFAFLAENRPELGTPSVVFLGGSQAIDGGIHKVANSDHDVLVIFPEINAPESFTFTSLDGTHVYDLILRDTPSLTYDVLKAKADGKGTILHLASFGCPIYDPTHSANTLQDLLNKHYRRGPNLIHDKDSETELASLVTNLSNLTYAPAFEAGLSAVSNRIAKLALRFTNNWTSNGKIGGRFLKQEMPDFCMTLRCAYHRAAQTKDLTEYYNITDNTLPLLLEKGKKRQTSMAPPTGLYPLDPDPTDLGEATTAARINLNALAHYFSSANPVALSAATTWTHSKLNNLIKPLTSERFQKKPDEYFFALGRAISGYADTDCALIDPTPNSQTMTQRINESFHRNGKLCIAFHNAHKGDSDMLQALFESILTGINRTPLPNLHRPSPAHMKADPALLAPDKSYYY